MRTVHPSTAKEKRDARAWALARKRHFQKSIDLINTKTLAKRQKPVDPPINPPGSPAARRMAAIAREDRRARKRAPPEPRRRPPTAAAAVAAVRGTWAGPAP